MAEIQFDTAAPTTGLLSGVTQGLNAGMIMNHEKQLQEELAMKKQAAAKEQAHQKMVDALGLIKESWVPNDYKLMLYNQNVRPALAGTNIPLPDLKEWPDFGSKAAKDLGDIIEKGRKAGLHPQEIQTMASMALMKYEPEFMKRGEPVLNSLKNEAELQNKLDVEKLKDQNKYDTGTRKRLTDLAKALDPTAYRTGEFGKTYAVQQRAERLEALGTAFSNGNLDSRQIEELAIGLNSMLAGGNVAAQSQTEMLVPKTVVGNVMKLTEWLTNSPTGMKQQEFVKRLMGTIDREKHTAMNQLKRARFMKIAPYEDLMNTAPEAFNNVLASGGVTPAEYQKWISSGRQNLEVVPPPEDSGAGAGKKLTATNPKTGQKIVSTDGGMTWQPLQ